MIYTFQDSFLVICYVSLTPGLQPIKKEFVRFAICDLEKLKDGFFFHRYRTFTSKKVKNATDLFLLP